MVCSRVISMAAVDWEHLRSCHERSGYTVAQLAEELGTSEDCLRNVESGARLLKRRPDLVRRVADLLDVSQKLERRS